MILNSEKYCYMCIGNNCTNYTLIHNGKMFENSKGETILGVTIDNKLTFDSLVKMMCKEAGQKLSVLSKISAFGDLNKRQVLLNFVTAL